MIQSACIHDAVAVVYTYTVLKTNKRRTVVAHRLVCPMPDGSLALHAIDPDHPMSH
jgi:hypothetical protein